MRGERQLAAIVKIINSTASELAQIVMIRQILAEPRKDVLPKSLKKLRTIGHEIYQSER